MKQKLLNLGCGTNIHKDWVNIDIWSKDPSVIRHDLKNGIPFPDGKFDAVYHSHILEHFSKNDAVNFICECSRVLKKGGIIRVCVPDLEQISKWYLSSLENAIANKPLAKENYEWMMLELLDQTTRTESGGEMAKFLQQPELKNKDFIYQRVGDEARGIRELYSKNKNSPSRSVGVYSYKIKDVLKKTLKYLLSNKTSQEIKIGRFRNNGEIHQWMYDRYSLAKILEEAGFHKIQQVTAVISSVPSWKNYHLDASSSNKPKKPDSLYMEAVKK